MDNRLNGVTMNVPAILEKLLSDTKIWDYQDAAARPWFRGQTHSKGPIPSLFEEGNNYDEFNMNTMFRNRASSFPEVPETDRLDQWLFLAQHYGLPTRLLDWTENPLYALWFALKNYFCPNIPAQYNPQPSLWVIHPYELNKESNSNMEHLPNTWTPCTTGNQYCRLAFHPKKERSSAIAGCKRDSIDNYKLPIAIASNYFTKRIFSQNSCFTIHGTEEKDFETLFEESKLVLNGRFYKYVFPVENHGKLYGLAKQLPSLGIGESSIFPDLEGLARELRNRFWGSNKVSK